MGNQVKFQQYSTAAHHETQGFISVASSVPFINLVDYRILAVLEEQVFQQPAELR